MKLEKKYIIAKLGKIDLFICTSSFENRSISLASCLISDSIKESIIFHLDDTYTVSNENLGKIKEKLPNIRTVVFPKNKSLETFDLFYEELSNFKEKENKENINVVIDISTFTREVLLILIKVISLKQFSNFKTQIVYTPNENYSEQDQSGWMTRGIREIRSILGYSGLHLPSRKLLLLILNGFEEERTEQIIESFEPNKIVLGKPNSEGSINSNLNNVSCEKFDHIKSKYKNLVTQEFEFSCTDINFTIDVLNKIISENSDFNVVISPLNNKISTIATAILALKNEDIQICYASANQYNVEAKGTASDYFLLYNLNELLKS